MSMFLVFARKIFNAKNTPWGQISLPFSSYRFTGQSHYDVLKVPETCSTKEIRDAFIALSKKNHPDKNLNDPSMHEKFVKINEAYTVLNNPSSRRSYDLTLSHKRKLEASYPKAPQYHYYTYNPSNSYYYYNQQQQQKQQQRKQQYGKTYTYANYEKPPQPNPESFEFGWTISVSNRKLVMILITLSAVTFGIQMFTIRNHAMRSKRESIKKSHRLKLMHAMAKEKVRLYGRKHQVEVLKNSLAATFNFTPEEESELLLGLDISDRPIKEYASKRVEVVSNETEDSDTCTQNKKTCPKCKKSVNVETSHVDY